MMEYFLRLLFGPRLLIEGLEDVLPQLASQGATVRVCTWIPWLGGRLSRMKGSAAGVAIFNQILLAPGTRVSTHLLIHELEHVKQWKEERLFLIWYSLESIRHGYWQNRYEVAARQAETSLGPNRALGAVPSTPHPPRAVLRKIE